MPTYTVRPTNVQQIRVVGYAMQQAIVNVFHYANFVNDVPPHASAEILLNAFITSWRNNILPLLHETYNVQEYTIAEISGWEWGREIMPGGGDRHKKPKYRWKTSIAGAAADKGVKITDASPTMVAVSAKKFTGVPSRLYRGASRFAPIVEADTVNNDLVAGTFTDWNTALAAFTTTILQDGSSADRYKHVVFSFVDMVANEVAGHTDNSYKYAKEVVSFTPKTTLGSQVSRKPKAGGR